MGFSGRYIFIIDTGQYAGNFEREMCAHLTNQVGECGVGDCYIKDVEEIEEEMREEFPEVEGIMGTLEWIEENISQENEEGCLRPCAIWPTPGRTNNGMGAHTDISEATPAKYPAYESVAIFFDELPPPSVLDYMVARSKTFCCRGVQICVTGYRLLLEKTKVGYVEHTPVSLMAGPNETL